VNSIFTWGGSNLDQGFPDDLSPVTEFHTVSQGVTQVRIDLTGKNDRYFVRLERDF